MKGKAKKTPKALLVCLISSFWDTLFCFNPILKPFQLFQMLVERMKGKSFQNNSCFIQHFTDIILIFFSTEFEDWNNFVLSGQTESYFQNSRHRQMQTKFEKFGLKYNKIRWPNWLEKIKSTIHEFSLLARHYFLVYNCWRNTTKDFWKYCIKWEQVWLNWYSIKGDFFFNK